VGKDSVISTVKQQVAWLIDGWNRFFFQPADSLPLSLLRILCGSMLLYTHTIWGSVLTEFLGEFGWNSPELIGHLRGGGATPSLWWYVPEDWMSPVHWTCNFVILLFIIGLGGRFTAVLTWMIAVSYAHRTSLANFGLDQTNCILAFYLIIGPATQYLSVDRWLARRWWGRQSIDQPSASAQVALRLIQLHLCIIYLWAGLGKLQGEAWWTGDAIWLALANQEYQSMDMTWLARFPRLLELMTHATIFWELSFSALVWPKATRWVMLSIGAMMHLGIGMFLGMWTFGSIMIFSYVSFASGAWLRQRFGFAVADGAIASAESQGVSAPTELPLSASLNTGLTAKLALESNCAVHLPSESKTVVLITASQQCVDQFVQVNQRAQINWVVVPTISAAESLAKLSPVTLFLHLEMASMKDSELQYLAIRVVTVKKNRRKTRQPVSEAQPKRALPR
jgi:Vitamin K-dependent gamma-carboxylase